MAWPGHPPPRLHPVPGGSMLNAVGLQNPGVEEWARSSLPSLLAAGARVAASVWGRTVEEYHCNYGLNPDYRSMLENGELRITGVDTEGEVRVVELVTHPFFIATLFQPERRALKGEAHPLVDAYVRAVAERAAVDPRHS